MAVAVPVTVYAVHKRRTGRRAELGPPTTSPDEPCPAPSVTAHAASTTPTISRSGSSLPSSTSASFCPLTSRATTSSTKHSVTSISSHPTDASTVASDVTSIDNETCTSQASPSVSRTQGSSATTSASSSSFTSLLLVYPGHPSSPTEASYNSIPLTTSAVAIIPLSVGPLSNRSAPSLTTTTTDGSPTTSNAVVTGSPLSALQSSDLGRALGAGLGIGISAFVVLVAFAVFFLVRLYRRQPPTFKFEPLPQPDERANSPPPPSPMHAALLEAATSATHAHRASTGQDLFAAAPRPGPSRPRHTHNASSSSLTTPLRHAMPFGRSRPSVAEAPRYASDPFAADGGSIYARDNIYSLEEVRAAPVTPPPVAFCCR